MRIWFVDSNTVEKSQESGVREFVTAFYSEKFTEDTVLTIHDISNSTFATAYRFNLSAALPERPIGSILGEMIDGVWWLDPPRIAYDLSGETIVMTKDCFVAQLFMKRKDDSLFKTTDYHLLKTASVNALNSMGIPVVISHNDSILALPDGKNWKIGCGYVKGWMTKQEYLIIGEPAKSPSEYYRREALVTTFYYDHDLFASILPEEELNRDKARDPDAGGITGIENNYPSFDRDLFIIKIIDEVEKILEPTI